MIGRLARLYARYVARHGGAGGTGVWPFVMLLPGFTLRVLRAVPDIALALMRSDPQARTRVRDHLGLGVISPVSELNADHITGGALKRSTAKDVTIVMPVYNALRHTQMALVHLAKNTELPWHLILVEDASTDPAVRPWLRDWAAQQNQGQGAERARGAVTLLENSENLGFVGAANRGLAVAQRALRQRRAGAVVLLNSDAVLPPRWAGRLLAAFDDAPDVASVTPFSNAAELLSAPHICEAADLPKGAAGALDRAAQRLCGTSAPVSLPTGVGFCMALSLAYLRAVPQFDPAFGRGYGEEVDWCQRTAKLGGRHLACPQLFVAHHGGASFGKAGKAQLLMRSSALLQQRYPRFDADVQRFIADDPLATPRLALAMCWANEFARTRKAGPLHVYLAHSLGGGADMDLQRRISQHVAQHGAVAVLRVGGAQAWQIEVHSALGLCAGSTNETGLVQHILAQAPDRRMIYSCGVGAADMAALPAQLLRLCGAGGLGVLMHDYLPLSPSYTLLNAAGQYRGVPNAECPDPAHHHKTGQGEMRLGAWRDAWGQMMAAADEIEVFSKDSRDILCAAYPACAAQVVLRPHELLQDIAPLPPLPSGQKPVLGILGNLNAHKGAKLLPALYHALRRAGIGMVVIGNIDPGLSMPRGLKIHGTYTQAELTTLAARYQISEWFIPSIWPETFSFTTHEALATGRPVYACDLGAQGAAVRAAWGARHVIGFDAGGRPDLDQLVARLLQTRDAENTPCIPLAGQASHARI